MQHIFYKLKCPYLMHALHPCTQYKHVPTRALCTYRTSVSALMLKIQIHPASPLSVNKAILHLIPILILEAGSYKCSCFVRSSEWKSRSVSCLILSCFWDHNWWKCAPKINSESSSFCAAWRVHMIDLHCTVVCTMDTYYLSEPATSP